MSLRLIFPVWWAALFLTAGPMSRPAPAASTAPSGPDRDFIFVQQRAVYPETAAAPLEQPYREIAYLRRKIATLYGGSDELTAVPYLTREMTIGEQVIRMARKGATDSQMHVLIEYLDTDADLLFSMIVRHSKDPALVALGLSYTSARRARFAREQFQEFSDWKASVRQNQPALWQSLRQAQDRFTDLSVLPSFTGDPRMDLIRQQADAIGDIERDISKSGDLRRAFSMGSTSDILADMGVDQLVANVNFGKVLIVYVLYEEVRSTTKNGALERGPSRYLAIVGHAGAPLAAVDLGPAKAVDELADAFLTSAKKAPKDDATFDKRPAGQLFKAIVAPLMPYFKYSGVDYGPSLLISADGVLLCIPFAALVDGSNFLIDRYQIALLDTPADANLIPRTNLAPATSFLAFANPSLPAVLGGKLQPLVEAEHEAGQIAALWPRGQQQILRQSDATPDALNARAANAGILHIAGHGLFAASPLGPTAPQAVSAPNIENDKTGLMASSLARSVVVLAPPTPGSTGFFSALDVLGLDLSHTQMVVLAACDSGTGDQERGEGIYGLRRSFLEAGAETVVSSLWAVDSAGTREMMVSFYRNLFQGQPRGDALQHAAAFTRLKYPHPYYWAAFAITGNLGGLTLPKDN
jgi:CHAT domain-containing protein